VKGPEEGLSTSCFVVHLVMLGGRGSLALTWRRCRPTSSAVPTEQARPRRMTCSSSSGWGSGSTIGFSSKEDNGSSTMYTRRAITGTPHTVAQELYPSAPGVQNCSMNAVSKRLARTPLCSDDELAARAHQRRRLAARRI
jgi:hypothetical protein